MANLIAVIILIRTSWIFFVLLVIANLLYSTYLLKKKKELDINTLFSDLMHKFIFTITTFFPLREDNIREFMTIHFGMLIQNLIMIAFCRYLSDWGPNWFIDNSYYIVIVLFCIGMSVLLMTPLLRHLYKLYVRPITIKITRKLIYYTFSSKTTNNLIINL